jgi:hypothetical protein
MREGRDGCCCSFLGGFIYCYQQDRSDIGLAGDRRGLGLGNVRCITIFLLSAAFSDYYAGVRLDNMARYVMGLL